MLSVVRFDIHIDILSSSFLSYSDLYVSQSRTFLFYLPCSRILSYTVIFSHFFEALFCNVTDQTTLKTPLLLTEQLATPWHLLLHYTISCQFSPLKSHLFCKLSADLASLNISPHFYVIYIKHVLRNRTIFYDILCLSVGFLRMPRPYPWASLKAT